MASDPEQITANILRVDHAGEYGAIRIYAAQRHIARWRAPDLLAFLDHTLSDERRHQIEFEQLMQGQGVRPCRALPFWGLGGSLLGLITAMLGRSALLVCTEAVERTVHRHLEDQIRWLSADHPQIADRLINIQVEEMEHLQFAVARTPRPKPRSVQVLDLLITGATEALIWLSTYGASLSVARQIKAKALRRTP